MSWHRRPKNDDWKRVTLASLEALGQDLWLHCGDCPHTIYETPGELAGRARLDMSTPLLIIGERLRCSQCGERKGHCWPKPHGVQHP
jgi:hypothetical protein